MSSGEQSAEQVLATEQALSFEQALEALEKVVAEMEKGDLSLEASLTLYERGMALSDHCQRSLDEAERKVRILSERGPGESDGTGELDVKRDLEEFSLDSHE
ncbi:MAG: exodeoxyribonuclease VII small subunit [Gammaproteobacteria bacterium]|nr:exodeoxyribonuclease VII small subunit [Gammaproteobacteria bacterium]